MRKVDTCAFLPCEQADVCCLPKGCVQRRFKPALVQERELPKSKAFNGTEPARTNRDPALIQRRRKPLTR